MLARRPPLPFLAFPPFCQLIDAFQPHLPRSLPSLSLLSLLTLSLILVARESPTAKLNKALAAHHDVMQEQKRKQGQQRGGARASEPA